MRYVPAIAVFLVVSVLPGSAHADLRKPCRDLVKYRDNRLAKDYERQLTSRINKQYRALQKSARLYARLKQNFERDARRLRGEVTRHNLFSFVNAAANIIEAAVPASKVKVALARTQQRIAKELLELYHGHKSARTHLKVVKGDVESITKIVAGALADTYKRDIAKSLFSLKAYRDRLAKMTEGEYNGMRALQDINEATRNANHKLVNYKRKMAELRADRNLWKKSIHRINQVRAAIDSFCHIDPDYLSGTWYAKGGDGYTIVVGKGASSPAGATASFTNKKGRWKLFSNRLKFRNLRYVRWNTWQADALNAFKERGRLGTRWLPSTLVLDRTNVLRIRSKRSSFRLYRR